MEYTEEQYLAQVGEALKNTFPGLGFVFLLFCFDDASECNYVSNAEKEDIIKALRETANKIKNGDYFPEIQGNA